jgi:rubredoxin
MTVTRTQILARGLTNRCPNCGGKTLFVPGKLFQMHEDCPACGFTFEGAGGQEGFSLRATSLNFGVTLTCYLLPVVLLAYTGQISEAVAEGLAFGGALLPLFLYRPSRSWSLLNYYIFCPEKLPANGGEPEVS